MCVLAQISKKLQKIRLCLREADSRQPRNPPGCLRVSGLDVELIEQALDLEEKRHQLETRKELDRVQITFSRILAAAAILTLGLILLSSFEIPCVSVSSDLVSLMIGAVIVEIAGIVTMGFTRNLGKEDKKDQ